MLTASAQLTLSDVTKRYDDRVILDTVGLSIRPGEKVGIVSDNGSGKSTLLRLISGRELPDNGELTVQSPGGMGYLAQTLDLPPTATVAAAIDVALADIRDLEARMRAAEQGLADPGPLGDRLDAYAELAARFEARGGYLADQRVDTALHGLGLPDLDRTRPLGALSGGERSRLALAATLAAAPELLLLDEPTNDLDDSAVEWLEQHLRSHRGTVVAVTHDRVFLERITSTILEVEAGRITRYGNGYEGYLTDKAAERRRQQLEHDEWRAELARSQRLAASNVVRLDAIPRNLPKAGFGFGAFRARGRAHGAMSRIRQAKERVDRLTDNPIAPPPDQLRFTAELAAKPDSATLAAVAVGQVDGVHPSDPLAAQSTSGGSQPVVELTGVVVNDRLQLDGLRLGASDRLLVTGPNGAGKTTLLRLLAGKITPDTGAVTIHGRVGHLRQEESPWQLNLTVLQAFGSGRVGYPDEYADQLLSLGLFRPAELTLRIGELSYGQRRRIELAGLVTDPADLLLLDEPTNHLSPGLVEDLEQALAGYPGAVVLVTHDRRMRAQFTGRRLELRAGVRADRAAA
ncbi:ABC-F family ATP-binding cassette domain-containing protein [Nocardia crassostreae]|uniref:ABC-F family ATP-binding cassette domain-containing protein n=1 Tax=Nocardia crassostreae TaxID=53428 RepID=UPI00082A1AFC|nr:ABC-F family ATP-binding cassette domain-containing protein [Nocardia crassostreae]